MLLAGLLDKLEVRIHYKKNKKRKCIPARAQVHENECTPAWKSR